MLDDDDVGVLYDAIREGRDDPALREAFGVGWAEILGLDEHGLWATFEGLRLRRIPPGHYRMGSPVHDPLRCDNEASFQPVELTKGFWLGATLVTKGQWRTFAEGLAEVPDDQLPRPLRGLAPNHPQAWVTWEECGRFLERLPTGPRWRLPTEAEWEYACRAGTRADLYGEPRDVAWFARNSDGLHPVAEKLANPFGLYDMQGNLMEWCADRGSRDRPPPTGVDPLGTVGDGRVTRGASWATVLRYVRAAYRNAYPPDTRAAFIGLRLAAD